MALNRYFDCAILPVNRHCGEVIQIIGDGILAIFNESVEGGPGAACRQAFDAAKEGIDAPACWNQLRPDGTPHLTAGHWHHT